MKKEKNEIIKGKGRKKGTEKTKRERKEARKEGREKGRKNKSSDRPTWPGSATVRAAVPISISVCDIFNVHAIVHRGWPQEQRYPFLSVCVVFLTCVRLYTGAG